MNQRFLTGLLLALLVSGCGTPGSRAPGGAGLKVVLVSLDGLRPDFYLTSAYHTPTLRKLIRLGTSSKTAIPPYPSITYPSHATIATGANPATHGVFANTILSDTVGPTDEWYWQEDLIKAQTLWQTAKAAGRTVASIGWPTTLGAKVDWLVPEVFSTPGIDQLRNWEALKKYTDPLLLAELVENSAVKETNGNQEHDQFITDAAVYLLRKHSPDLLLLHYRSVDLAQHFGGRDSPLTHEAVESVDRMLGQLYEAVDPATTALVVVGDHGFMDYRKVININVLFVQKGWIQIRDGKIASWKVIAQTNGGEATVYFKDPELQGAVLRLLKKNAKGLYAIVDKARLRELKTLPTALCALDPMDGFSMGKALHGTLIVDNPKILGQHGYLPSHPQMGTGFIAVGPGVAAGKQLREIRLLDVAATVSYLMKIPAPLASEGRPIPLD